MARDIDIGLLRAFVAVADSGGMTKASRLLNLTQAAVSQQIKRLEDLLDLQLFDRSQKQIKLTYQGERLMPYAKRMIMTNDEIWGFMTSPEFEGEVRLGVPDDIVNIFMPTILKTFKQCWPRVQVSLVSKTTPELRELLENGELDLTLTTEEQPGTEDQLMLADPLVWVGAPDGEAHHLRPLPVAFGSERCAFRSPVVDVLSREKRDWQFICEWENMAPLYATLQADMAVAPFLSKTVPNELRILGSETGLPVLPTFYINLYERPAGMSDVSVELMRVIREHFRMQFPLAA